jgi:flagellar hook-associated protein 1 FlgK
MAAGLTSLLSTARDALTAHAYGVTVAGQNITNVNTPGYTRREVLLETRALGKESYGGVNVQGLRQISDAVLEREQLSTLGYSSSASQHDQELARVEALFSDEMGSGLGTQLDKFFQSFSDLAARPNDPTARNVVLNSAEEIATRVNGIADELATTRDQLLTKARSIAADINDRASSIAELNRRIHIDEMQGHDAADLKDQRNQVMLDLASMIDVKTAFDGSGNLLVHAAGTVLVEGANARSMSVDLDADGKLKLLAASGDAPGQDVTRYLTGGTLAGVRDARDVDVFAVAKRLDDFVFEFATAVNTQHAAGVGQDGVGLRNLFDIPATSLNAARGIRLSADVAGNPAAVAAASSAASLPGGADNAVALSGLGELPLGTTGRNVFQSYGDLIGDVGTRKSAAQRDKEMRAVLHNQAQAMREAMSGVSLDEEMISLSKFQQAYTAASKVITVVDEMLQELMARVGR